MASKLSSFTRAFIRRFTTTRIKKGDAISTTEHGEEIMNIKRAMPKGFYTEPPYWHLKIIRTAIFIGLTYACWFPIFIFSRHYQLKYKPAK